MSSSYVLVNNQKLFVEEEVMTILDLQQGQTVDDITSYKITIQNLAVCKRNLAEIETKPTLH